MRLQHFSAALLAVTLAACGGGSDNRDGEFVGGVGSRAVAIFDPLAGQIPFPNNLLFAGFRDPTLNIPNGRENIPGSSAAPVPFVSAANEVDGFSTVASLFTDLTGFIDYDSVPAGLVILETGTNRLLEPGVDFRIQPSTARDPADDQPINAKRSRILIEPLRPLRPSTTYLVGLTTDVRSTRGEPILAPDYFRVVRSTTPVQEQDEPVLQLLTEAQKARLEQIRQSYQPILNGLGAAGVSRERLANAWAFTTESTTLTLERLDDQATAQPLTLFPTGRSTAQLGLPGPNADLYVGRFSLPYYLGAPSESSPGAALTSFWQADPEQPNLFRRNADGSIVRDEQGNPVPERFLGQVPCGAFAQGATINGQTAQPSLSTTLCYPLPLRQSTQTVPVLLTLPQTAMPQDGWPVVIFQHGITGSRANMLGLVPALTQAGFAVIAIDLPLHGIRSSDSTAALRVPGTTERTFEMDVVSNETGAPGPDNVTDASGTHFINLSSLLTSRDNLRQAVVDLVHLTRSLVPRDGSGNGAVFVNPQTGAVIPFRFDTGRIHFVGHSLGGIVGTALLGVNEEVRAATLGMPGGGIAKLLDASLAFGPRVAAGLAAASAGNPPASRINEGNDNYETFLRFAQQVIDPADPLNFAALARARHPIHMIEVVGDRVVPNCALPGDARCPNIDTVTIGSDLAGSTPLARALGLTFRPGPGEGEALRVPVENPQVLLGPAARHNVVRFADGEHGTLLTPDASAEPGPDTSLLAVLQEMQRQTASFLASDGQCLPIGTGCPTPP